MSSGRGRVNLHAAPQYVGYEVGLQRNFGWLVGCGESRCVLGVAAEMKQWGGGGVAVMDEFERDMQVGDWRGEIFQPQETAGDLAGE